MPISTIHISEGSLPYKCWCGNRLHGPAKVYVHDTVDTELYEYKECTNCLTFYVRMTDGADNGDV